MAPNHRMATCIIQKNMSTLMAAILCYLFKPREFLAAGRNIITESGEIRFCKNHNEYNSGDQNRQLTISVLEEKMADGWEIFTVVRDPLDRFLSAYLDKCIRWE